MIPLLRVAHKPLRNRRWALWHCPIGVAFALAGAGCSDVGDSSAVPSGPSYGDDGSSDSTAEAATSTGPDATVAQDTGAQGTGSQDAAARDAAAQTAPQDAQTAESTTNDTGVLEAIAHETGSAAQEGAPAPGTPGAGAHDAGTEATISNDAGGAADSTAGDGAQDAGTEDTGALDASLDSPTSDARATPDRDGEPPDAGVPDATPDTGPEEAGGGDAGGGGGTLAPCTSASQTNCAQCSGNTSGVCTDEEAYFVEKDIAAGRVTASGAISLTDPSASCYSCLVNGSGIDAPRRHVTGVECGDVMATFANASGASVAGPATCLALIQCLAGTTGAGCTAGNTSVTPAVGNDTYCYCGAGGYGTGASAGPSVCGTTNAALANGTCLAAELAGFNSTDTGVNLSNYADNTQPSGMANQLVETSLSGNCAALCLK